jgi:hypothetical protein
VSFWSTGKIPVLYKVANVKFCDLLTEDAQVQSLAYINDVLGLNISLTVYFKLRTILSKMLRENESTEKPISVEKCLNSFKKGSKKIRLVLTKADNKNQSQLCQIKRQFFEVAGTNMPENCYDKIWSLWACSSLPNDFRDFLYKYFFNKLGINARTFHFGGNTKECTFCSLVTKGLAPVPPESFPHLFLGCPVVTLVHERLGEALFNENCTNLWLGCGTEDFFKNILALIIQYHIWKCKLRSVLPSSDWILGESIYFLDNILSCNNSMLYDFQSTNSLICRIWRQLRAARW